MAKKKAPAFVAAALSEEDRKVFYAELSDWYNAQRQLSIAKEVEAGLRRQIAAKYFANAPEGINTVPLDFGKQLKCGTVISRTVDDKQLEAIRATAKAIGKTSLLVQIDGLFTYKPSLLVGEWKALSQDERNIYADVVTEKPGMPSLEIAAIKE